MRPEAKRAKANAEMIAPTWALFTPKDFAKSGIVGAMIPKPTATKNDAKTRTPTSLGNSRKGLADLVVIFNLALRPLLLGAQLRNLHLCAKEFRGGIEPQRIQLQLQELQR
jgi:hypothetical protein